MAGAMAFASMGSAYANGDTILHAFTGPDGSHPRAALVADSAGNLYGTSVEGTNVACGGTGCGAVFTLAPDSTETVLHTFLGPQSGDGAFPYAGLTAGNAGVLYGTTGDGGHNCHSYSHGCGTVFELTPDGTETVLHIFKGKKDGTLPAANLVVDKAGNLYGTTYSGGGDGCGGAGCGTIFQISSRGKETILHVFAGGSDGALPFGGLVADKAGDLYGTTTEGGGAGCSDLGCGTAFKLAADGTETVLHAFTGGNDGANPFSALIADGAGNLYGATTAGGSTKCDDGCGTIFKIAPDGETTVLYSFAGGADGQQPFGALIADKAGNLFGTTAYGAGTGCVFGVGCGTVFELAPNGTETVLHAFKSGTDGAYPYAGLIADKAGNLYGTTNVGGSTGCNGHGCGTVFELTP
jgi:uncharacterized repeat protein (TIGR03803 family)